MARITTEDRKDLTDGPFELVAITAERTKQLISGAHPVVDTKNDKPTVTALRELHLLDVDELRKAVVARLQQHAIEDHSKEKEQETNLADDLIAEEAVEFLHSSGEFDMFSEEEFDSNNMFADDNIIEDDETK